jgi:tRNA modification GTPase
MRRFVDTIIAPFTGPGPAAVTGYRICGPDAWEIITRLIRTNISNPVPRHAYTCSIITGETAIVLFFADGDSYTGDETVEVFAHGSRASRSMILDAAIGAGARMAQPGEFTQRAFLNGKMDLASAESIADLVEAETQLQWKLALQSHRGALAAAIGRLRETWLQLLASVEASTDFSEEIGDFSYESAAESIRAAMADIQFLIRQTERSEMVREGFRIAIVGRPNVGKSSLLNALLKRNRAIVTDLAGTTRDTIEESFDLDGRKVVLIDTAGLRETTDAIEKIGIERTHAEIERADLTLLVFDLEQGWTDDDQRFARTYRHAMIVGNKLDKARPDLEIAIGVSARTGSGLDKLLNEVAKQIDAQSPEILLNPRHAEHLRQFGASATELLNAVEAEVPSDLLATLLREGIHLLGQISGETVAPDILQEIFSRFCIGK